MTVEQIRAALADRNLSRVADATGLHHNTLIAIRSGAVKNPNLGTIEILTRYLLN